MNRNLTELERGNHFHLSIATANAMRSEPEFAPTKAAAKRRRQQLQAAGYRVHIWRILPSGGLIGESNA